MDHVWTAVIALLSLAAAWSARPARSRDESTKPQSMSTAEKMSFYLGASAPLWILGGATVAVWVLGSRPLSALGLDAPNWTFRATVAVAALLGGLLWDTARRLSPGQIERTRAAWRSDSPYMPATTPELARYSVLAVSAGFAEELAYRGFVIAYLGALFGLEWPGAALAIGLPALFFGASHAYQGARGIIGGAAWALVWGFVLVETGSLWPAIAFHILWDLAMGIPGLWLLRDQEPARAE